MSEQHKGTHLGYLDYHVAVIEKELNDLNDELKEIRSEYSDKQKFKKERDALLDFRQSVRKRIDKVAEQSDGVKKHLSDKAVERAERQYKSAYNTHQKDDLEEIPRNTGFEKASNINGGLDG